MISEGRFHVEEETTFELKEVYDSVDSWTVCLSKPRVGELVANDRLIDSACSSMREGEGEIIVTEMERAARLRRLDVD